MLVLVYQMKITAHVDMTQTWSPKQYFDEFGLGVKAIQNDDKISVKNKIVGVCHKDLTSQALPDLFSAEYCSVKLDSRASLGHRIHQRV